MGSACVNHSTFISLSIFSSSVSSYPSRRNNSSLVKAASSGCSPRNVSVSCTNCDTFRLLSSNTDIWDWLRLPLLAVRPAVNQDYITLERVNAELCMYVTCMAIYHLLFLKTQEIGVGRNLIFASGQTG